MTSEDFGWRRIAWRRERNACQRITRARFSEPDDQITRDDARDYAEAVRESEGFEVWLVHELYLTKVRARAERLRH